MQNSNAALAIYNHKNVDGLRVGYLRDFLSDAGQVIYFAYNCPQSTFDKVNSTMFGKLEACTLGVAKSVDDSELKIMSCQAGKYNEGIISPAESIYFY
jgi:succinylglutamate desuccinylase